MCGVCGREQDPGGEPLLLYESLNHSRTCFPSPPLSLYGSLKLVHVILHVVVVRCVVRMGGSGFVSCFLLCSFMYEFYVW